jgi:hypothetical protein
MYTGNVENDGRIQSLHEDARRDLGNDDVSAALASSHGHAGVSPPNLRNPSSLSSRTVCLIV